MTPAIQDKDRLEVDKGYFKNNKVERGDIIIYDFDGMTNVKRVIGLPGDTIEYKSQQLYINGLVVKDLYSKGKTADFSLKSIYGFDKVPNDTIFVLGDNREESLDSRFKEIGFIPLNNIEGKIVLRYKPFNRLMKF